MQLCRVSGVRPIALKDLVPVVDPSEGGDCPQVASLDLESAYAGIEDYPAERSMSMIGSPGV